MSDTATTQQYMTDEQVRNLLDGYGLAKGADLAALTQKVDGLTATATDTNTAVAALAAAPAADAQVIEVDAAQWQEMQESWLHAKSAMGVGLFLVLVLALLVAALLGNSLWSAFSKGWRK